MSAASRASLLSGLNFFHFDFFISWRLCEDTVCFS
jgi:hypothetical protein